MNTGRHTICTLALRVVVGRAVIALAAACPSLHALDPSLDITQYVHTAWTAPEGLRGSTRSMVEGRTVESVPLAMTENKFREVVEFMPVAFVASSENERTFVNKGRVEYTGLMLEQASGSSWHAAVYPDDLKRVLDTWRPF